LSFGELMHLGHGSPGIAMVVADIVQDSLEIKAS